MRPEAIFALCTLYKVDRPSVIKSTSTSSLTDCDYCYDYDSDYFCMRTARVSLSVSVTQRALQSLLLASMKLHNLAHGDDLSLIMRRFLQRSFINNAAASY